MRAGNEHHHKRSDSQQGRRPQIDFSENKCRREANDCKWKDKSEEEIAPCLFAPRKPGSEENDCRQLRQFRRLKRYRPEADPAARSVKAHSDMRKIAKRQCDERQRKPQPPCALPKVII